MTSKRTLESRLGDLEHEHAQDSPVPEEWNIPEEHAGSLAEAWVWCLTEEDETDKEDETE